MTVIDAPRKPLIFLSQRVNLDPEPWVNPFGNRVRTPGRTDDGEFTWAPRPEFEPTHDPEPWACQAFHNGVQCTQRAAQPWMLDRAGRVWAPRREQFDTPVNRVLVLFRRDVEHTGIEAALEYDWPTNSVASSAEERDHARRVLTRLENWRGRSMAKVNRPRLVNLKKEEA